MDERNGYRWFSKSFRCMDFGDVVGIMTTIIQDDGPLPMRDRKQTERIKNAADKFKESHQPNYEHRFMKNGDEIQRMAVPYLPNKHDVSNNLCTPRASSPRSTELKRQTSTIKRKYEKKPKIKIEKSKTKTITKAKCNKKTNVRNYKCICHLIEARNKKDLESSKRSKKVNKALSVDMDLDIEPNIFFKNDKKHNSKHDVGTKNPDTSYESISTYVSFPSTNHEPQVRYHRQTLTNYHF